MTGNGSKSGGFTPKAPVRRGEPPGRPWGWYTLGALVVVLGGGVGVATLMAGSIVRSKLDLVAKEAGLVAELQDVTVRPWGRARLAGLKLKRPDGSAVLAADEIDAQFSPWKAALGRRRPEAATVRGLHAELVLLDGKPKELLDLYRAVRTVFPKRAPTADDDDAQKVGSGALTLEGGSVLVRALGKGAQFLPKGLNVRDITVKVDLANGVGDVGALVEGAVTSKLAARLVPQDDGPPRLEARFEPEFRLTFPADAGLPLGIDALAIGGFGLDATGQGGMEDIALRHGTTDVLSVKRVRPAPGGLGLRAEEIAFAVPDPRARDMLTPGPARPTKPAKPAQPKPDAAANAKPPSGQPVPPVQAKEAGARIWAGTVAHITVGVEANEKAELTLVARLENLRVALPGTPAPGAVLLSPAAGPPRAGGAGTAVALPPTALGVAAIERIELRTDRLPGGERPLDALTLLKIEGPTLDVPWREDAVTALPGGRLLWGAILAAEVAKLRQQAAEEVDDEGVEDPNLPPEARRKKVEERMQQKLQAAGLSQPAVRPGKAGKGKGAKAGAGKSADPQGAAAKPALANGDDRKAPGAASRSAVAAYVKPLRDLQEGLVGVGAAVQHAIDRANALPRLKVEVVGGRIGLQKAGAEKPFGGLMNLTVQGTAVLGDGTRGLLVGLQPFDEERVWGDVKLDVVTGPGTQLQRAKLSIDGSSFAQVLRIVSSNVTVAADSEFAAHLELRLPEGRLEVTGDYLVKKVGFDWWRLAPKPVDIAELHGKVLASASSDKHDLRVEFPDLTLGAAKLVVVAEATDLAGKHPTVHVRAEMPTQDCGAALTAIPPGLITTIGSVQATGEFRWLVDLTVPLLNVYKAGLDLELDDAACEVAAFTGLDVGELAKDFVRPVNENGVVLEDVLVGPTSDAWVPLADLPPWTPWAMIATEDGAFYKHRGLRPGLLLRAIRLDLDYGRFVYGGSTITQQLVKNVWLTRAKHLSRKFEELLIVWQMERSYPKLLDEPGAKPGAPPVGHKGKDRILELYVNMIEFGPKIYGVQRAAQAYFGKPAKELTPLESAFLAANKPCPRCGYARFSNKKWDPWWQERMIGIMTKMRDERVVSDEQFLAEAPYVPRFVGWPSTVAPVDPGVPLGGVEE
ncbi:MAG: hypothetical protein EXR79_08505 [Myxococcales bacterium]|nr:hypothetical protein [Myxococcales bacterium]